MTSALTTDQFAQMAAALLGEAGGATGSGVDVTNRAQLLTFAQALLAADSESSGDEPAPPRPPPFSTCRGGRGGGRGRGRGRPRKVVPPAPSSSSSCLDEEAEEVIESLSANAALRVGATAPPPPPPPSEASSTDEAAEEAALAAMLEQAQAQAVALTGTPVE